MVANPITLAVDSGEASEANNDQYTNRHTSDNSALPEIINKAKQYITFVRKI